MIYNWNSLEIEYLSKDTIYKMMLAERNKNSSIGPKIDEVLRQIEDTKINMGIKFPEF
jgi:hypothetical protein